MNILRLCVLSLVSLTGLFASAYGAAPIKNFSPYLSVGAGYGYVDYRPPADFHGRSYRRGGLMWNGNVGMLFVPNVGIDLGYMQFDNVRQGNAPVSSQNGDFLNQNTLYTIALKGILYGKESIDLFAKGGVAIAHMQYTERSGAPQPHSVQQTRPYVAVGVVYEVTKNISVGVVGHAMLASGGFGATTAPRNVPAFYATTAEVTATL
jgi:hypothetical protein